MTPPTADNSETAKNGKTDATSDVSDAEQGAGQADGAEDGDEQPAKVYGDGAYGTGEFQSTLEEHGVASGCKTQPPTARGGLFGKGDFGINLDDTVTCPAGTTVPIHRQADGAGTASFAPACADCPLRERCTTAAARRTITINPHEDALVGELVARGTCRPGADAVPQRDVGHCSLWSGAER